MLKMAKKTAAMLLTGVMILSAGCGGGTADNNNAATNAPATAAPQVNNTQANDNNDNSGNEADTDAGSGKGVFTVTATLEGNADTRTSMVEDAYQKMLSEKMGREIDIQYNLIPGSEYSEKVSLLIAVNDITDYLQLPFLYDATKAANEGMFLDLKPLQDKLPGYFKYVEQITDGMAAITTSGGNIYNVIGIGLPRFPSDMGVLTNNVSTYRYDIFEKHGIPIPETIDDVYTAAKQLKELYPDVYPINSRWKDLRSLFYANHTVDGMYWDGSAYKFGYFDEGYKDALMFANKLYTEGLLDPEYIIDTDDTLKSKELTDRTFIVLSDWFTTPGEFTRLSDSGQIFAATYLPNNPKYGEYAWQSVQRVNEVSRNGFYTAVVSSKIEDVDGMCEYLNLQFDDEVIDLISWGIEGVTYNVAADGTKTFTDEIMTAPDPWVAGDNYGMRASRNKRPGLSVIDDSTAFVALAPNDYIYYDGALHVEPFELSPWVLSLPYPTHAYIPPMFSEPVLTFTDEESQENSQIETAVKTYKDEMALSFIKGEESFDNWDSFLDNIRKMGDVDKVVQNYNNAAARFYSN